MVDDLQLLLDRIAAGAPTEADLATLRRALSVGGEPDVIQVGKYNVRIDEGREVQIGDRHFHGPGADAILAALRELVGELRQERAAGPPPQPGVLSPDDAVALVAAQLGRPLDDGERQEALRYGQAVGFKAAALQRVARRVAAGGAWPPLQNGEPAPYVGLRTFQERDAPLFYGRDRLVDELLAKAAAWPFLAVVGPSGSGKSSVVRAGLIPRVRSGGLPDAGRWTVAMFRPGPRPLDALAVALARAQGAAAGGADGGAPPLQQVAALRQALETNPRALLLAADLLAGDDGQGGLLLVIDQFEELWTLAPADEAGRQRFVAQERDPLVSQLLTAAEAASSSVVKVIVTLRSDFQHRTSELPALAGLVDAHIVRVYAMSRPELLQAIQEPAWEAGGDLEPGLAEELAARVADAPGALPLLGFTLFELWKRRDAQGLLTWAAYRGLGGVEGALALRADAVLQDHYAGPALESLRHTLLRLVQPGENVATSRRRVPLETLTSREAPARAVQALLQPLVEERLVTTGRDDVSGQDYVEISHEALIASWPTLAHWIEDASADLRFGRSLEEAAADWQAHAASPDYLWGGLRLANAESWQARARPLLSGREEEFLAASQAAEQARQQEARRQQELALELADTRAQQAEAQAAAQAERARQAEAQAQAAARRARRLRRLTVALGLVLLVPLLFAVQWLRARLSPWQLVAGFPVDSVAALAEAPAAASANAWRYCVGTFNVGLACSFSGERWNVQQEGFPVGEPGVRLSPTLPGDVRGIVDIAYDPLAPGRLYVAASKGGVLRSDDGGRQWQRLAGADPIGEAFDLTVAGETLLALPADALSCASDTGLYASRDGGATWQALGAESGLPQGIYAAYLAADGSLAYAGGRDGLFVSQPDQPGAWQQQAGFGRICDIAAVPGSPDAVYVAEAAGSGGRLLRYRPGQAPELLAELRNQPQVIAPHPDPASPIIAYVLHTWHNLTYGVSEVRADGTVRSLGGRPGWGAPFSVAYDLLAVRPPNGNRTAIWLWLGHSDGLVRYNQQD